MQEHSALNTVAMQAAASASGMAEFKSRAHPGRQVQSTGTGRYKLYGNVFAFIPAYYPGLKVHQLERRGRIVLDEVINDRPPYWFVTLLNARTEDQALLRQHFGEQFGGGRILGNRRFVDLTDAKSYFEALYQVPKFAAEIERRSKVKAARKERLVALQSTLQMYSTPPTKTSPVQKGKDSGRVKSRTVPTASLEKEEDSGRVEHQGISANLICYDIFRPVFSFSAGTPPDPQRFGSNGLRHKKGEGRVQQPFALRVARRRTHASGWASGVVWN